MTNLLGKRSVRGILFLAFLVLGVAFTTHHAFALATGDVSKQGCDGGCAVTENPDTYYAVWASPAGGKDQTVTVAFQPICSATSGQFQISVGLGGSGGPWTIPNGCTTGGKTFNISFTILGGPTTGTAYAAQGPFPSTAANGCFYPDRTGQFCTAILDVELINSSGGHHPFNISPASANGFLGYAGQRDDVIIKDQDPVGQLPPLGAQYRSYGLFAGSQSFSFKVPCNTAKTNVFVAWEGADDGPPETPGSNESFTVTGTDGLSKNVTGQANIGAPTDIRFHSYTFSVSGNNTYTWTWKNVSGNNEIVYSLPFSENTTHTQCPKPGSWGVSASSWVSELATQSKGGGYAVTGGYSTLFTHTIQNNGPDNASYTWQVLGSYNGNSFQSDHCGDHGTGEPTTYNATGSNTGQCPGGTLGTNSVPNANYDGSACTGYNGNANPTCRTQQEWYQFPSNAADGDKYCQEIEVTPGSSNNGAAGPSVRSSPKCVTYRSNTYYEADCTVDISSSDPSRLILANSTFNVRATITNASDVQLDATNLGIYSGDTAVKYGGAGYGYNAYDHTASSNGYLSGSGAGNDFFFHGATTGGMIPIGGQVSVASFSLPSPALPALVTDPTFAHVGYTGANAGFNWDALPACNVTFNGNPGNQWPIYQHFTVTPINPGPTLDSGENPTSVNNVVGVTVSEDNSGTATLDENISSGLSENTVNCGSNGEGSGGGGTWSTGTSYLYSPYTSAGYSYSACRPPTINDQYCSSLSIDYGSGYIGPPGLAGAVGPQNNLYDVTGGSSSNPCAIVHNEPYVHFFGGDVEAGGGFGAYGSCTSNNTAGINTYLSALGQGNGGSGPPVGSGVQLGALAIGPIHGFSSAMLRGGSTPEPSTGLSFANDSANVSPPLLGGNMGAPVCVTDYYATKPASLTTPNGNNMTHVSLTGANGKLYYTGNTEIDASTIAPNHNVTVYVSGNLSIGGDITYGTDNGSGCGTADPTNDPCWSSPDRIPSLYIIVEGGDIDISPSVQRLDGIYVSQPDSNSNGGTIYTCANGFNGISSSSGANFDPTIYGDCKSQLLVNGAFVDNHTYLSRTFGSLRNSSPGEHLTYSPKSCGADSGTTLLGDCAAEIFNFSPEMFLSQPSITPATGPTSGRYDYITSLSPVL